MSDNYKDYEWRDKNSRKVAKRIALLVPEKANLAHKFLRADRLLLAVRIATFPVVILWLPISLIVFAIVWFGETIEKLGFAVQDFIYRPFHNKKN